MTTKYGKSRTRQQAIDANCKECIYDELDAGTWRQQVEKCTSKLCPLWEYRPVSTPRKISQ